VSGKQNQEISSTERVLGQRAALRANLMQGAANAIVVGPLMMLFANDVLAYSAKRIAAVLAIMPLVGLAKIALLEPLRRMGKRRLVVVGDTLSLVVIVVLALSPPDMLFYPLYVALLCTYQLGLQFGVGVAWQPLLRDITTDTDRGRFFASMRFRFQLVAASLLTILPLLIGRRIELWQYRLLLLLAAFGTANRIFWVRRIPELAPEDTVTSSRVISPRVLKSLRYSRLLRLPLLIAALLLAVEMPLYVVYLRSLMAVPANIVSGFIAAGMIGMFASLLFWGRMADAIGFRPMLTGLLFLKLALLPLHFLIAPFPDSFSSLAQADLTTIITVLILGLQGFFDGALLSGVHLTRTTIEHHHVSREDSFEAMNLYHLALILVAGAWQIFFGFLLEDVALPRGSVSLANGLFHFDWIKGYLLFGGGAVCLLVVGLLRKLANTRPWYGVGDFFASLSMAPLRLIMTERRIYHEDEDTRCRTARWFAAHPSPLAVGPLCELMRDPSYDVRVAAIRALAETASAGAGQQILTIFTDPNARYVASHAAWALGELRYRPAFDALTAALHDAARPEVQSMAARALGKIGDERAVAPLVRLLQEESAARKALSSAARALLRFEAPARQHAKLLFHTLSKLEEREDRFEIMDGLCALLEIPNRWLLRHLGEQKSAMRALETEWEYQSPARRRLAAPIFTALREHDYKEIQRRFKAQADPDNPVHGGVIEILRDGAEPAPSFSCHVMIAAWLLYML
jgi:MFS family permease